jgi:hypothetical protein
MPRRATARARMRMDRSFRVGGRMTPGVAWVRSPTMGPAFQRPSAILYGRRAVPHHRPGPVPCGAWAAVVFTAPTRS